MAEYTRRDDELTDPKVRQLLWRLRARLVVPPDADRVEQDLARLLASAQEHAHDAPEPDDSVVRQLRLEPVAGTSSPEDRRASSGMALGHVAAAVVLLAALGGGIAAARDGSLSLQVLLGTTTGQAQPVELAAPEPPPEPETTQDAPALEPPPDLEALEPDAPDPADGVPDVEVEAEPQPAEPATEPGVAEPVPAPQPSTPAPSPGPGEGSGATGGDGGSASRTPEIEQDPELVEPPASEVIAAPPARDLDGFGGPQPCPEDQDLASCLEDRAGVEEGEDDASGTGDDASSDDGADPGDDATGADDAPSDDGADPDDDATSDEGSGSEQDELARRRGAG